MANEIKHVWVVERQDADSWRPVYVDVKRSDAAAEARWRRRLPHNTLTKYRVRKYIREGK